MYTVDQYKNDIHLLTNSLVIKNSTTAVAINFGLERLYDLTISSDKTTWKYYLNISGQKHHTNSSEIYITLIENTTKVLLTKTILDQYPYTRKELLKYGNYYKELISLYPNDFSYINGCMLPVDMTVAINAAEGKILNYNSDLVFKNEFSLIRELELYIKNYLKRWDIIDYVLTDELYAASLLAVLFAAIPNKIANLRLHKINTAEVHPFHMEHFFRSHLDLWDNIASFKESTKFWLYKNLRYLMKHTGSTEAFKSLLLNVFDANGIGVGEHILFKKDPSLNSDILDTSSSLYSDTGALFIGQGKNNSYQFDINSELDIYTIVNLEMAAHNIDVPVTPDELSNIARYADNTLNKSLLFKQKTKVIDINIPQLFKLYGDDIILTIMDNWIYLAHNNSFTEKVTYLEPNTKVSYNITPLEAYYLLLKFLLKLTNNESSMLTNISCKILKDPTVLSGPDLVSNLFNGHDVLDRAFDIIDMVPVRHNSMLYNKDTFKTHIDDITNLYKFVWITDVNSENALNSSNIKIAASRVFETHVINFENNGAPTTIDAVLSKHGIVLKDTEYFDISLAIKDLFIIVTGINIDAYDTIETNNQNYIDIITKLTSYTVHAVNAVENSKTTFVPYTSISVIKNTKGLVTTTGASIIDPLEPEYTKINLEANNYDFSLANYYTNNLPFMSSMENTVSGYMEIINQSTDLKVEEMLPVFTIEVLRDLNTIVL
jgi:hypothetical protein